MDGSILPIASIFAQVSQHQAEYANIYPPLLALLINHFPELFLPDNILERQSAAHCEHSIFASAVQEANDQSLLHQLDTLCKQVVQSPTAVCFGMKQCTGSGLRGVRSLTDAN
jgi:hypothetical protein